MKIKVSQILSCSTSAVCLKVDVLESCRDIILTIEYRTIHNKWRTYSSCSLSLINHWRAYKKPWPDWMTDKLTDWYWWLLTLSCVEHRRHYGTEIMRGILTIGRSSDGIILTLNMEVARGKAVHLPCVDPLVDAGVNAGGGHPARGSFRNKHIFKVANFFLHTAFFRRHWLTCY